MNGSGNPFESSFSVKKKTLILRRTMFGQENKVKKLFHIYLRLLHTTYSWTECMRVTHSVHKLSRI